MRYLNFYMPRISYFLGIAIYMYYDDHNPPHFHAVYNEYGAIINIETLEIIAGELPSKVLQLIKEWAEKNKQALLDDWENAINHEALQPIPPLV